MAQDTNRHSFTLICIHHIETWSTLSHCDWLQTNNTPLNYSKLAVHDGTSLCCFVKFWKMETTQIFVETIDRLALSRSPLSEPLFLIILHMILQNAYLNDQGTAVAWLLNHSPTTTDHFQSTWHCHKGKKECEFVTTLEHTAGSDELRRQLTAG